MGRPKRTNIIIQGSKRFPFSPGIKWDLEIGRYIVPKIDYNTWDRFVGEKDIIVTAFGTFIESLFSLCVLEAINSQMKNKLFWIGDSKYENLHYLNGISSICNISLTKKDLENYPVPLFCDAKSNVYFNVLNDVPVKKSFWGIWPKERTEPIFQQIFTNSMLQWDSSYLPKMRRVGTDFFDNLVKQNKITNKSKIITIILENADVDILDWKIQQVKEFIQIISNRGYKVILFSRNLNSYYGTRAILSELDYRKAFQVIKRSFFVLSNDIQWLLAVLLLSSAAIVGKNTVGSVDLFKNAEYIGAENDIFSFNDNISTLDMLRIIEGI